MTTKTKTPPAAPPQHTEGQTQPTAKVEAPASKPTTPGTSTFNYNLLRAQQVAAAIAATQARRDRDLGDGWDDVRTGLQRRREAAKRCEPLPDVPGDVRDPDVKPLKPSEFGVDEYRRWWKSADRRTRPAIELMARFHVQSQ